jgi:hypothetical protein
MPASKLKKDCVKIGMDRWVRGDWASEAAVILLALVALSIAVFSITCHFKPEDPRVAHLNDKLDALNRLNLERIGPDPLKPRAPPVDLIELNTPKWRVEYLNRSGHISSYDGEGRHPLYWYTRLDGGFYAVEEVIVWNVREYIPIEQPTDALEKTSLREGVDVALGRRKDALMNPCYNYVDMESVVVVKHVSSWVHKYKNIWKVYIFYMVAKWVDWTSLPLYRDGRFTAEGYADPVMKPIAFIVRYAPYDPPYLNEPRAHYSLGAVRFCKYLDPPADCKDADILNGTFVMRRVLDDGRWYIKIDTSVQLNKTGLYTFELIAEDLRAQGRKCSLMHYTVEIPK